LPLAEIVNGTLGLVIEKLGSIAVDDTVIGPNESALSVRF
jgi:hypothetical protein